MQFYDVRLGQGVRGGGGTSLICLRKRCICRFTDTCAGIGMHKQVCRCISRYADAYAFI